MLSSETMPAPPPPQQAAKFWAGKEEDTSDFD